MPTTRTIRYSLIRYSLLAILPISGCSSPLSEERQARREARIQWVVEGTNARAEHRKETLAWVGKTHRRVSERSTVTLAQTENRIKQHWERDVAKWAEPNPVRDARIHAVLAGEPENIPRTWTIMIY